MIYQYQCSCGHLFEQVNSYEKRHTARCPECSSTNVRKLLSNTTDKLLAGYLKDANGESIWFPRDGKPYFDKALRRTFVSAKEKQEYMTKNKIVMRGDAPITHWPKEAGDMRDKSYRRSMRWED